VIGEHCVTVIALETVGNRSQNAQVPPTSPDRQYRGNSRDSNGRTKGT